MRLLFLLLIFVITGVSLNAQTLSLKVLGSSAYNEYAESNGVIISFLIGDHENKKLILSDSIRVIGINGEITPLEDVYKRIAYKRRYRIEESNIGLFDRLLEECSNQKVRIEKVYYKMPEHKFENEDKNAILAFKNASTQAKIIANNLNYKITKVLNIDDDTTKSSDIYDVFDNGTEHGATIIKLLELLYGSDNMYSTESDEQTRVGGYNLWVTFEMRRK